jgi:transposase-like protein
MTAAKLRVARQMQEAGSTVTEIAATIGVGRATLYRHLEVAPLRGRDALDVKVTS